MVETLPPPFNKIGIPETEDDISMDDIYAAHPMPTEPMTTFPTFVIVDHLPVIPESKRDKLLAVLKKILKPYSTPKMIDMPSNEDGTSKGWAFVECETKDAADKVVRSVNGHKLDKQHVLAVYRMDDVEKYLSVPDVFVEKEVEPWQPKEHLRSWLTDAGARDQFVALRDEEVAVFYNQKQRAGAMSDPPELVHNRVHWTESYVQWSPLGSYLTTFHRQGVALWGGASWSKIIRFYHPGVKLAGYSPKENYLVTWSPEPIKLGGAALGVFGPEDDGHQYCVWEVRSGRLLRSFPDFEATGSKFSWPVFKWSPSENYIARVQPGVQISVYEVPSMGLMEKKSIKIEGVKDFEWMPHDPEESEDDAKKRKLKDVIAYWTPEIGNQPARVTLMSIPQRDIVRTKNLFNVSECKIYWHPRGDFLCVKVDRHTKTKKSMFSNLEIFRIRDREVPVEVVELKDVVVTFKWEPVGDRFCIVSAMDQNTAGQGGAAAAGGTPRTIVQFYGPDPTPGPKEGTYRLIKGMDRKQVNAISWSPKGRHVVLWTSRSQTTWDVEFWDMDFEPLAGGEKPSTTKADQVTDPGAWCTLINTQEHYGITDLEWDPTGRFVLASGSAWRQTMENGFALFDASGRLLYKRVIEKFKQILWRPRPPTLLTKEQQAKIRKNYGKYAKEFDDEDKRSVNASSAKVLAERDRLLQEWKAWRERVTRDLARDREEYGMEEEGDVDEGDEVVEEWVEEVVDETEEILD